MNHLARLIRRLLPQRPRTTSVWIRGEDAAASFMRSAGYRIIARNLRLSMGEIDLLCEDPRSAIVVLVEVKARLHAAEETKRIDPEASITAAKAAKLRTLAKALAKRKGFENRAIRIDVIAVVFAPDQRAPIALRHYESAV